MDRCRVAFGARGQDTVMRHDRRPGELAREVNEVTRLTDDTPAANNRVLRPVVARDGSRVDSNDDGADAG